MSHEQPAHRFLKSAAVATSLFLGAPLMSPDAAQAAKDQTPVVTQPTQIIPVIPTTTEVPRTAFDETNKALTELWTKPVESPSKLYAEVARIKAKQFVTVFGKTLDEKTLISSLQFLSHDQYVATIKRLNLFNNETIPFAAITFKDAVYIDQDRLEKDVDKIYTGIFPHITSQFLNDQNKKLATNRQYMLVEHLGEMLTHEWGHLNNIPQKVVNLKQPITSYDFGSQTVYPINYLISGFNNIDLVVKPGQNNSLSNSQIQKMGKGIINESIAEWHALALTQATGRNYYELYEDYSLGATIINQALKKAGISPSEAVSYFRGNKPIGELFNNLDGASGGKQGNILRALQTVALYKSNPDRNLLTEYRTRIRAATGLDV